MSMHELRSLKAANRASRKDLGAYQHIEACRNCGTCDPIHIKRNRRRSRGAPSPAGIVDTLRCATCGTEWIEFTSTRQTMKGHDHD